MTLKRIGTPDDGGFGHTGVADESAFDFGGADSVAGDIEDIVDTTDDPEVSVFVLTAAVAGEVGPFDLAPIGFLEPLGIAPQAAKHGGPWLADDEFAAAALGHRVALIVDDFGADAEKRQGGRAGLGRGRSRERGYHDRSSFCLPPGIDDGATSAPDDLIIPHPRFGIDGLANGAQKAE